MDKAKDINKMDLYGILGVNPEATDKEIAKAYRKKALKCHPDKNPDNPKAAELFHDLSKALQVLTDVAAKAAYDNVLKARKVLEQRNKQLDSKRKKLKEDLEAREHIAEKRRTEESTAQNNLSAEIEKLRKEGSRLLEQEQEFLRQQMRNSADIDDDDDDSEECESPKIKIRWNARKAGNTGTGISYTEDSLRRLFARYGKIAAVVVSSKKKGSAIIEFASSTPLMSLIDNEIGNIENPLSVTWLSTKPKSKIIRTDANINNTSQSSVNLGFSASANQAGVTNSTPLVTSRDYESLVLMKMRQAEERKRLIEEMMKEDD